MSQTLWFCFLEDAAEWEVKIWERLKEYADQQNIPTMEADSRAVFERAHQKLIDEGWRHVHIGSGCLRRVSTYVNDIEPNEPE